MIDRRVPSRWRPIPSCPGYEAADYGRIYNTGTGRKLYGTEDRYGYRYVNLWLGPKMVKRKVHRLVCEAWHGPPPGEDSHAAHLDGNPQNNRADNLAWATPQENNGHKKLQGRPNGGRKHSHLTAETLEAIRSSPLSSRKAAAEFGISQCHVVRIRNGTRCEGIARKVGK